jgi:hypothetical protein
LFFSFPTQPIVHTLAVNVLSTGFAYIRIVP